MATFTLPTRRPPLTAGYEEFPLRFRISWVNILSFSAILYNMAQFLVKVAYYNPDWRRHRRWFCVWFCCLSTATILFHVPYFVAIKSHYLPFQRGCFNGSSVQLPGFVIWYPYSFLFSGGFIVLSNVEVFLTFLNSFRRPNPSTNIWIVWGLRLASKVFATSGNFLLISCTKMRFCYC